MITEDDFIKSRCKRMVWNRTIREYYKAIRGDGLGLNDSRLCIRFGERTDEPYAIYLVFPHCMVRIKGVSTVAEFNMLHRLVKG